MTGLLFRKSVVDVYILAAVILERRQDRGPPALFVSSNRKESDPSTKSGVDLFVYDAQRISGGIFGGDERQQSPTKQRQQVKREFSLATALGKVGCKVQWCFGRESSVDDVTLAHGLLSVTNGTGWKYGAMGGASFYPGSVVTVVEPNNGRRQFDVFAMGECLQGPALLVAVRLSLVPARSRQSSRHTATQRKAAA